MTVRELVEKLEKFPNYLDVQVERMVPTGNGTFVGEPIERIFCVGGQTVDGQPLPESTRKVVLL